MRVGGPAFTVASPPFDNPWLHRAIAAAPPGSVLVVTVGGAHDAGYWGDITTTAALARGLGGLVIDGCVRDLVEIAASGFPVFARGLCIRGTAKDPASAGCLQGMLDVGSVQIRPGDVLVGDDDGVVAIAADALSEVIARARRRVAKDTDIVRALRQGRTTLDLYGWK
jgi:4-hydroxy-4-methyl-2-oxoglutarate aldolase